MTARGKKHHHQCKYKSMLEEVYKILRKEYPEEDEIEIMEEFGELGEPYSILKKIKAILNP